MILQLSYLFAYIYVIVKYHDKTFYLDCHTSKLNDPLIEKNTSLENAPFSRWYVTKIQTLCKLFIGYEHIVEIDSESFNMNNDFIELNSSLALTISENDNFYKLRYYKSNYFIMRYKRQCKYIPLKSYCILDVNDNRQSSAYRYQTKFEPILSITIDKITNIRIVWKIMDMFNNISFTDEFMFIINTCNWICFILAIGCTMNVINEFSKFYVAKNEEDQKRLDRRRGRDRRNQTYLCWL
jgi:hypothetical protein